MTLDNTLSNRTTRFVETTLAEDPGAIQKCLSEQHVEILLDPCVGGSFTGQAIVFTLLNLLVRLDEYCPVLDVILPTATSHPLLRLLTPRPFQEALQAFFAPFPAASRIAFHPVQPHNRFLTLRLVVSPDPVPSTMSVWADGWIVYLNEVAPAGPWNENIVGASVAAGIVAAETFKRLIAGIALRPGLTVLPLDHLIFSSYDYRLDPGQNPPLPSTVDVGGTVVVGLGGIGAAFVMAAASVPGLSGELTLVDKDVLDETNMNRHLVSRPGDTGPKVDVCQRALAFHPGVEARQEWFDEFIAARGDQHDIIVVGVDKDRVRRDIQGSRPRLVLNAGTSDSASFRVTRHDYLHGACLSCIAHDHLESHPVERELAHQLGLDLEIVLRYQASGEPMPGEVLRQAGKLDEASIEYLGGRPLSEIQARVCSEVILGIAQEEQAVSISFLSALPGFLLLGELIKERGYPGMMRPPLNAGVNHTLFSVLGRPHPRLLHDFRDKRAGCDCSRVPYQRAYQRKWAKGA